MGDICIGGNETAAATPSERGVGAMRLRRRRTWGNDWGRRLHVFSGIETTRLGKRGRLQIQSLYYRVKDIFKDVRIVKREYVSSDQLCTMPSSVYDEVTQQKKT